MEDLAQNEQIEPQKGKRIVIVEADKFVQRFETDAVPLDRMDVKTEKAKAESAFISLVLNERLLPSHFKRCQKCDNHFYQETPRNKNFCSNSCSSGVWQKKRMGKISGPVLFFSLFWTKTGIFFRIKVNSLQIFWNILTGFPIQSFEIKDKMEFFKSIYFWDKNGRVAPPPDYVNFQKLE